MVRRAVMVAAVLLAAAPAAGQTVGPTPPTPPPAARDLLVGALACALLPTNEARGGCVAVMRSDLEAELSSEERADATDTAAMLRDIYAPQPPTPPPPRPADRLFVLSGHVERERGFCRLQLRLSNRTNMLVSSLALNIEVMAASRTSLESALFRDVLPMATRDTAILLDRPCDGAMQFRATSVTICQAGGRFYDDCLQHLGGAIADAGNRRQPLLGGHPEWERP